MSCLRIFLLLPAPEVVILIQPLRTWWRHQMETFSALLAICAGNSPVTGEFPAHRPVTQSFDVFFDLRLYHQLSKQWRHRWFETPWCSLWCHCNEIFRQQDWHSREIRQFDISISVLFKPLNPFQISCIMFYYVFVNIHLSTTVLLYGFSLLNTLRPKQSGSQFPDDNLKSIFLNENI